MTHPRPVLPGHSFLLTRRCSQRQLLMVPSSEVNQAFLYCLAEAAQLFDIDVHSVVVMSNHYHATVTDKVGNYPQFLARFHRHLAKVLNHLLGRWENFWASEQTSMVRLIQPDDLLDKMVHSFINPVEAGLVRRVRDWPGVCSLQWQLDDEEKKISRPGWFFRQDGGMPEQVTLRMVRPPGFEHLTLDQWRQQLINQVRSREHELDVEHIEQRRVVLGRSAVLNQSPHSFPKTTRSRRTFRPRIACKSRWHRIEALRRNRDWLARYKQAFLKVCAGVRDVLFPFGTYKRRLEGCLCAEA